MHATNSLASTPQIGSLARDMQGKLTYCRQEKTLLAAGSDAAGSARLVVSSEVVRTAVSLATSPTLHGLLAGVGEVQVLVKTRHLKDPARLGTEPAYPQLAAA
jgi:hypothetical protein